MLHKIFNKKERDTAPEMILSQNVTMSMDTRTTRRNCNVLVVGSDQQQRDAHYVLPNLAQLGCSYVIMDDAAAEHTIQDATEQMFRDNGYDIKVFNVIQPENSLKYNPFNYIRDDADVLTMVDTLTKNFDERSVVSGSFELQRYRCFLLQSIAFYLYKECVPEDRTLANVLKLLECADNKCENEEAQSILDSIMSDLKKKAPEHIAVKQYEIFKNFQKDRPEDAKKIIADISLVNLAKLRLQPYADLTSANQLDLETIGLRPTILYVKYSSQDATWNWLLIPVLLAQLFEALYYTAETSCASRTLPTHVRIFLNNFGAYGVIPRLSYYMATMRTYNMSCNILIESLSTPEDTYPDEWKTIAANCDEIIYFAHTIKVPEFEYFTKMVDKNNGCTRFVGVLKNGRLYDKNIRPKPRKFKDTPANIKRGAKPLTTPKQLSAFKQGDCAVFIRGCVPIADKVYGAKEPELHKQKTNRSI